MRWVGGQRFFKAACSLFVNSVAQFGVFAALIVSFVALVKAART